MVALLVALGCGQELDRAALLESFERDLPDATPAQAGCVVDDLVERFGLDEIEQELEAERASRQFANAAVVAMAECGYDLSRFEPWTATLVQNLDRLGYQPDDARCLADEVSPGLSGEQVQQLLDGEVPAGFRRRMAAALEACGSG